MANQNLAHRQPDGAEYVRERSGGYERIRKIDRPASAPLMVRLVRSLLGLR